MFSRIFAAAAAAGFAVAVSVPASAQTVWEAASQAAAQVQKGEGQPSQAQAQPANDGDWTPGLLSSAAPSYPRRALERGVEGVCDVTFQVDRRGVGRNFDLDCTDPVFEEATISSARTWRFTPFPGPEELSVWYVRPVRYSLSGSSAPQQATAIRLAAPDASQADTTSRSGGDQPGLVGIGIVREGRLPVVADLLPGSPAQDAGLRTGDGIVAVDGQSVTGEPVPRVIERIGGPAGQAVTLTIRRPANGGSDFDVTLVREIIDPRQALAVPMQTDLPVGGGQEALSARLAEIGQANFRGMTDVFIYEPASLGPDERAWLQVLKDELNRADIDWGASEYFGSDDGIVGARVWVTARRIVDINRPGTDLDFVHVRNCGDSTEDFFAASVSNWRRELSYLQYGFMDNREREEAISESRRASRRDIAVQIRGSIGDIQTAVQTRERCLAADILRFPKGVSGDLGSNELLSRGHDFGWSLNGASGWNVEIAYPFMEIDAPQIGHRPNAYYVEYLAEAASHMSDDVMDFSLYRMIGNDSLFAALGQIDPGEPAPMALSKEAQFIRSNYRLASGHTLLTYLIGRDYDPVLLRQLFTHGVLDFGGALHARDRFGNTAAELLRARGIPLEVVQPDFDANPFAGSSYDYPAVPTDRMIEAAIVGDNVGALATLADRGADFSQLLETPGPLWYSGWNFQRLDSGPFTPLELAVALGRGDIVEFLAGHVDVNAPNPETGRTPLFQAYATFEDHDGFPVPRLIAGQIVFTEADGALAMQERLLALGADPAVRDDDGQSIRDFQRGLLRFQQERNADALANRAEERDMQGTLDRWAAESRQQTWAAIGTGIVTGLRIETERLAAAERRRRAEEARRNALNRPVGRATPRSRTSENEDTSDTGSAGTEEDSGGSVAFAGSSSRRGSPASTDRSSRSSRGRASGTGEADGPGSDGRSEARSDEVSGTGSEFGPDLSPHENWGFMTCSFSTIPEQGAGPTSTKWISAPYRLPDTYVDNRAPGYEAALEELARDADANERSAVNEMRILANSSGSLAGDIGCTQLYFRAPGWTREEATSERDRAYQAEMEEFYGRRGTVIDSSRGF